MSAVKNKIESINSQNEKTLTVFLTSGFPNPEKFVDLVLAVEKAGVDIVEIGLPFADSLADGPVIQASYIEALKHNINIDKTLEYISEVKSRSDIPIILMSSSNPILNYGKENFCEKASKVKIDGLIIPDVPLEEYDDFFTSDFDVFDKILLTTPTSSEERIKNIDEKSSGFLYCVSVVGTTGVRNKFDDYVLQNLDRTYKIASKNKMQIGFGISSGEDVKRFAPICDGVIVGSAIIKSLSTDDSNFSRTIKLVKELKVACKN
jgi:tryptophan synthase alpha chain